MFALFSGNVKTLTIDAAALTDRGQKRKSNEDAVFHQTGQTHTGHQGGLYMVCDGLGGHQAGEVASHLAVQTVSAELIDWLFSSDAKNNHPSLSTSDVQQRIQTAIIKAHAQILEYAQTHSEARTMGTTITLALVLDDTAYIASVGDSRAYIYREGYITQITEDHSWAAALARMGKIGENEVVNHPHRNILYRTLGLQNEADFAVDIFEWELQPGDKLLLCSDGLWQAFPVTVELARWLDFSDSSADICQQLVTEAKQRNGSDDISAIVIRVEVDQASTSRSRSALDKLWRLELVK
jgi:serine/threonine protein phosphatase PrpC